MQTYIVTRDFPSTGGVHRKSEEIQLSERQARHLLIAGFIEKKTQEPQKETGMTPPKAKRTPSRKSKRN